MGHYQEGTIHDQTEKALCEMFKTDRLAAFIFIGDGIGEPVKNRCYWFRVPPSATCKIEGKMMARVDSYNNIHVYKLEEAFIKYDDGEIVNKQQNTHDNCSRRWAIGQNGLVRF